MEFSVLMSVYKKEKESYLREALDSIVNQTICPNEIVIVKDGLLTKSLDTCIEEYISKYPGLIRIIAFNENRGLGLALRDGVEACKYEYIARMDTDDISDLKRFEKQFAYLQDNPDVALLGTWTKEFSKTLGDFDSATVLPCEFKDIKEFAKRRNPFRHPTVIFKKSAILASGNYQDYLWFEDYDVFMRIILAGYKVANIPEYLVYVRADADVYARRGGIRYLKQDLKFQKFLYDNKYINAFEFITNSFIRSVVRIIPNGIRTFIYKNFIRRS